MLKVSEERNAARVHARKYLATVERLHRVGYILIGTLCRPSKAGHLTKHLIQRDRGIADTKNEHCNSCSVECHVCIGFILRLCPGR